tara:strand:+ start:681 stop:1157 length:477 start_codon:yes stop_codon:yes gene_type:complete
MLESLLSKIKNLEDIDNLSKRIDEDINKLREEVKAIRDQREVSIKQVDQRIGRLSSEMTSLGASIFKAEKRVQSLRDQQFRTNNKIEELMGMTSEDVFFMGIDDEPAWRHLWLQRLLRPLRWVWRSWVDNSLYIVYTLCLITFSSIVTYLVMSGLFRG